MVLLILGFISSITFAQNSLVDSENCPAKKLVGLEKNFDLKLELSRTPTPMHQIALIYLANGKIDAKSCHLKSDQVVYTRSEFTNIAKKHIDGKLLAPMVEAHTNWQLMRALEKVQAGNAAVGGINPSEPIEEKNPPVKDVTPTNSTEFIDKAETEAQAQAQAGRGPALDDSKKNELKNIEASTPKKKPTK